MPLPEKEREYVNAKKDERKKDRQKTWKLESESGCQIKRERERERTANSGQFNKNNNNKNNASNKKALLNQCVWKKRRGRHTSPEQWITFSRDTEKRKWENWLYNLQPFLSPGKLIETETGRDGEKWLLPLGRVLVELTSKASKQAG